MNMQAQTQVNQVNLENQVRDLLERKRFGDVIIILGNVLVKDPTNVAALNNMGAALLGLASREGGKVGFLEALYYFDKAWQYGLNNVQTTFNRGLCHEKIAKTWPTQSSEKEKTPKESPAKLSEKERHLFEAMMLFKALALKLVSQSQPQSQPQSQSSQPPLP
jgi:hypothetical protein